MENHKETLSEAIKLMEDFSLRTGLEESRGNITQRYLWTDAIAVQTFLRLAKASKEVSFKDKAIKLINKVHEILGRFHPEDSRTGWISGLSEDEGRNHPTIGGLRIGKKMPERKANQLFDERLEWERDGQYFHYITRWVNALIMAGKETNEKKYTQWASELLLASHNFVDKSHGRIRMYWKMDTVLSRPLVPSMGAHDPLEGLICARSLIKTDPKKAQDLDLFVKDMTLLCSGQDWFTTDDLGIGGLLLNAKRVLEMADDLEFPEETKPKKLLFQSLESLEVYAKQFDKNRPAKHRLPFRECGLSLGLRAFLDGKNNQQDSIALTDKINSYMYLAVEIEGFWLIEVNRESATWKDHLDINQVTLASSLAANAVPH